MGIPKLKPGTYRQHLPQIQIFTVNEVFHAKWKKGDKVKSGEIVAVARMTDNTGAVISVKGGGKKIVKPSPIHEEGEV